MQSLRQFRQRVNICRSMIELLPYDSAWPRAFAREADRLRQALPDLFVAVHHMGSTAIPGIIAKPVIDMLAVVERVEDLDPRRASFEALGTR